ncbi:hypothetical protein CK203_057470 [Vitis vinifera]|uniref:Uncharacterized protein n=1 Tax=Vitis vinifera TaxID=29760 RepID=A0A438GLF0_VITVI|nr:hypothetical protein CK203_057470 [Vitis vinifera]
MPHFPGIGHFSEHPHSADHSPSCSSRADCCHSGPIHCHPEADSASTRHYISSEHATPSPLELAQAPSFMHETMPPEEPPIGEVETAEPSSPQHHPPTI